MAAPADLSGKTAIVTGGGGGIGAALSLRLSARGAHVAVVDIDRDRAHEVAEDIGGSAHAFDVGDREAWSEVVATIAKAQGAIDLVALNAGIMTRPKGVAMADDDPLEWMAQRYELVRSVNLDGVAFGVLATLPHLRAGGGGAIAVTSSTAGLSALPDDPAYAMTKHGLIGLVRSLGPTLAAHAIGIGAVCPAGVDTSLVPPDFRDAGIPFAPADHVAAALEAILDRGAEDPGGIWVTLGADDEPRPYRFASLR